jgi:hypothetical protein
MPGIVASGRIIFDYPSEELDRKFFCIDHLLHLEVFAKMNLGWRNLV